MPISRQLPNRLTIGRVILAGVFFILLGLYEPGKDSGRFMLNIAFLVYLAAGITDILDGYLARKFDLTSAFGRIADPVTDKVLVIGALVMMSGSNFAMAEPLPHLSSFEAQLAPWLTGKMVSAVQAWMIVVILTREILVSAIRSYSESRGVVFKATAFGKVKMLFQSVAICSVLLQLANAPMEKWAIIFKIASVWLAVIVTACTGLAYVGRTRRLLSADDKD